MLGSSSQHIVRHGARVQDGSDAMDGTQTAPLPPVAQLSPPASPGRATASDGTARTNTTFFPRAGSPSGDRAAASSQPLPGAKSDRGASVAAAATVSATAAPAAAAAAAGQGQPEAADAGSAGSSCRHVYTPRGTSQADPQQGAPAQPTTAESAASPRGNPAAAAVELMGGEASAAGAAAAAAVPAKRPHEGSAGNTATKVLLCLLERSMCCVPCEVLTISCYDRILASFSLART